MLGAGASHAYGFPLGADLRDDIIRSARDPSYYPSVIKSYGIKPDEYREMIAVMPKVPTYSIDAFLERRPEFMDAGKKMIAIHLLQREVSGRMFHDIIGVRVAARKGKNSSPVEDWYQYLFNRLASHAPEEFRANQLVVVTFNYDRSLEHYLFESVKEWFKLDDDKTRHMMSSIEFIHLYGSLGKLPWQDGQLDVVPYDSWATQGHREVNIARAADSIKIVSEERQADSTPEFRAARKHIEDASKVLFLGFGFDPVNVERLLPGELIRRRNMCGTLLGLGLHEVQYLERMGMSGFNPNGHPMVETRFHGTTILDFLKNHSSSEML